MGTQPGSFRSRTNSYSIKVFIADQNGAGAEEVCAELNKSGDMASSAQVDVRDWNQQVKVFGQALAKFGRIDYVYSIAGINERRWIDNNPSVTSGFECPDLSVLDVDVTGLMYTVSLAIQQMRRQGKDENGFRGKIACVASVCGFYCCPTLPIYTAAKQ
jgi:NAD(P)-dependent dehydrogenase (short-subunit alcohol dehydrogenase family)